MCTSNVGIVLPTLVLCKKRMQIWAGSQNSAITSHISTSPLLPSEIYSFSPPLFLLTCTLASVFHPPLVQSVSNWSIFVWNDRCLCADSFKQISVLEKQRLHMELDGNQVGGSSRWFPYDIFWLLQQFPPPPPSLSGPSNTFLNVHFATHGGKY